ncbi:50S ribosomal protein L10 [Candidatus Saccharibacteria bacterium]|nr:50S ribosomal protein L10 [Candidatus Saccharibacteria bacterium]MBP7834673.1 50S ribosomal protein L10 [Candidatus Saccharibacteria bacterium]
MALTKQEKSEVVAEITKLLSESKMTVVANYKGVTVKSIQSLRKQAKDNGTTVKVVKNRLVKQALSNVDVLKEVETNELKEQLLYAFNSEDEVSPAKALSDYAKTEPALQFVGAITAEGKFLSADEVKALANLPSKNQLIAGIVNTLQSPLNNAVSALGGNLHGYLKAIEASKA